MVCLRSEIGAKKFIRRNASAKDPSVNSEQELVKCRISSSVFVTALGEADRELTNQCVLDVETLST